MIGSIVYYDTNLISYYNIMHYISLSRGCVNKNGNLSDLPRYFGTKTLKTIKNDELESKKA